MAGNSKPGGMLEGKTGKLFPAPKLIGVNFGDKVDRTTLGRTRAWSHQIGAPKYTETGLEKCIDFL